MCKKLQVIGRRVALIMVIIGVLALVPSAYTFFTDEKAFWGDFSWNCLTPVHLTAGDFREIGRGGLEHYPPKLRLIKYRVKKGDTLWGIAHRFGIDPDGIISCNNFSNVHRIYEGDVIYIPNSQGIFVTIHRGDTIYQLSKQYKIAPDFIIEINHLAQYKLTPGMKLFLPEVRYSTIQRAFALGEAFDKPAPGRLTSGFGYRRDPFTGRVSFHTGIDIANRVGTAVHAARDGTVVYVGIRKGFGKVIRIAHSFGYKTVYAHLYSIRVKRGQKVKKGEIIGFIGNSGRSTGPHLHFEVWLKNRLIDPLSQTNMSVY